MSQWSPLPDNVYSPGFLALQAIGSLSVTSYTPLWGNTGTANTLGNGTITGNYLKPEKFVFLQINLTWGLTTSSGDGVWFFNTPVAAANLSSGSGLANNIVGGASYTCGGFISGSQIVPLTNASPSLNFSSTSPFTWAPGDVFYLSVAYYVP